MVRGRGTFVVVLIIAILIVAVLLLNRDRLPGRLRGRPAEVPLDLRGVIPAEWTNLTDQQLQCNFDTDDDLEWLIVYRYDTTQVPQPHAATATTVQRGPIGAAIFDAQNNPLPQGVGNESPYRPTFLIPYRLLPDLFADKGTGYLGERSVTVLYDTPPPARDTTACAVGELTFLGYSEPELPTRLSIFRWQDEAAGYRGYHFIGNARVDAGIPATGGVTVRGVTTYNHLENHRSLLCEVRSYEREGEGLDFRELPEAHTVDFCYGAPADPFYPEGAVVALLRGSNPAVNGTTSVPPPTAGFFTAAAVPPFGVDLRSPGRKPVRILALTNFAGAERDPAGGRECTAAEVTAADVTGWWCGRERATVETEMSVGGIVRNVRWRLITVTPRDVNADVHWRVEGVELQP